MIPRSPLPVFLVFWLLGTSLCCAQTPGSPQEKSASPIQDNSFLIEEAYNQEPGVVQHINTFMRQRNGDWLYTFTQEWPVWGQAHQLSYTLMVPQVAGTHGFGDVVLNYRYQLVGDGNARVAVAPRFSLLLPTGDEKQELGTGGLGVQLALPVSVVLTKDLVTHWNAGATFTPTAKNATGEQAGTYDYNLGQSVIWLLTPTVNLMLETVYNSVENVVGPGRTERAYTLFLNPGIRWAHNFQSGLQIVPGIAFPVGVGPSHGDWSVFVYLSFEHPFKKQE